MGWVSPKKMFLNSRFARLFQDDVADSAVLSCGVLFSDDMDLGSTELIEVVLSLVVSWKVPGRIWLGSVVASDMGAALSSEMLGGRR